MNVSLEQAVGKRQRSYMKRICFVVLVWTGMWSPGALADDNIMATKPAYLRDSVGDWPKQQGNGAMHSVEPRCSFSRPLAVRMS